LSEPADDFVTPDELHSEVKTPTAAPAENERPAPGWFQRLSSVLFVIFCFELGLFLLIYPWTDAWTENYLSLLAPARLETGWRMLWNNSYVRGGVSGVGLVNIWIAVTEVFRMFARRAKTPGVL
jgi:hypothetical protein